MNYNSFNAQVFNSTIDAASALAQPFISNIEANTADEYTYSIYLSQEMQQNFGNNDEVWQNGGPIVGFNLPHQNFVAATDCSGFVARVLNATRSAATGTSVYAGLVTDADGKLICFKTDAHPQPFPSAQDYAGWLVAGEKRSFRSVTFAIKDTLFSKAGSFSEVEPGDILAYALPAGSKDTGHVMVVESIQQLEKGKLNQEFWGSDLTEFTGNDVLFYAVRVYDSSNVAHHNDQRGNGQPKPTGVGLGTVLIIAGASGAPIGFMFAAHDLLLVVESVATTLASQSVNAIGSLAVGRPVC